MGEVEQSSELAVAADTLWEEVGTLAGVNRELGPWLRMTARATSATRRSPI
jgi:hypothetical protein